MNPYLSLAAGALFGLGVTLMLAGWWPAPADPATAPPRAIDPVADAEARRLGGPTRWWRTQAAPQLVTTLHLSKFAGDLGLVDQTPATLAARKLVYAAAGLAAPVIASGALAFAGMTPPPAIPVLAAAVLAGALFFVPDTQVRRSADQARQSMRAAAGVFLELVALERAADAGSTEALDRAAEVGSSREFDRIRDALLRAELAGQPAWAGLTGLAERTGVVELGDVADIMRLSAADGAAVYTTLRARAASLRTQLLTAATARANAASEHMIVPVALLGVAFMALLGYPAFAQILFG